MKDEAFQWLTGSIHTLNMYGNDLITDRAFRKLYQGPGIMSIHTLDIGRTNLNGSCFEWLQGIQTLKMTECDQIQNESFKWLKGIKSLDMSYCYHITNLQWLRGIHSLSMRECSGVTADSFRSLQGIQFLDMTNCSISGEGMKYHTGIHTLIIDGCHLIFGLQILPLGSIDFISVVDTTRDVKDAAEKVGRIVNKFGSWKSMYYREYGINI
jgi:hypothetical protein